MFGGTVNEETFLHSQEYFFYITVGIPLYMFGQAMNPVIRADGSPRFAMVSTLAGAIANIILDPIFIFCFRWGMMGAAVATVIGQAITAALAVWYLCHMKIVKLSKQDFRLDGAVCGRTLGLGITSFLSQISSLRQWLPSTTCSANTARWMRFSRRRNTRRSQWQSSNRDEVFPDRHFHRRRHGGGLYPDCGLQHGSRVEAAREGAFTKLLTWEALVGFAALILVEFFPGSSSAFSARPMRARTIRTLPSAPFRVYLCMLPLACVNKGLLHLLAGDGQSRFVDGAFHDP